MHTVRMYARVDVSEGDWVRFVPQKKPDAFWNGLESVRFYESYKGKKAVIIGFPPRYKVNGSKGPGKYLNTRSAIVRFEDGTEKTIKTDALEYIGPRGEEEDIPDYRVDELPEPFEFNVGDVVHLADDLLQEERTVWAAHLEEKTGRVTYQVTATEAEQRAHKRFTRENPLYAVMPPFASLTHYRNDDLVLIRRAELAVEDV